MKNLNPSVKLFAILAIALVISFQANSRLMLLITLIFLLLTVKDLRFKKTIILFTVLSLSAVGVFFTGMIFYQNQSTPDSQVLAFQYGTNMAFRVYCFGILGVSFTASTEITDLIYSLQQQIKLPPVFAYGLLAAFQMAPLLPAEFRNIKYSLQSRGIKGGPLSLTFLIPLLVKSIRWSELLADAMISRGFDADRHRTYARSFALTWKDGGFLIGCLVVSILGTRVL